jgi:hypothetical protein
MCQHHDPVPYLFGFGKGENFVEPRDGRHGVGEAANGKTMLPTWGVIMTRVYSVALLSATALFLSGCASSLTIFDAQSEKIKGVPFRASQVYVKSGTYLKHTKFPTCLPSQFSEEVSLPTGVQYYANVNPAQFAKTGFSMKLTDKGALSEISLNTEPSSGDLVKNVAEAAKTVLPLLGLAALPAALGEGETKNQACDTGVDPDSVKYKLFVP